MDSLSKDTTSSSQMFAVSFPAQILQQRQLEQTYAPVPGMLIHSPAVIPRETHLHEKLEAMDLNFLKKLTGFLILPPLVQAPGRRMFSVCLPSMKWCRCLAVTISKGGTHRWDIQEGKRAMGRAPCVTVNRPPGTQALKGLV